MLRPLHTMLLCRPLDPEPNIGDLILPDIAKDAVQDAVVCAVGPGRLRPSGEWWHPRAQLGDRVIYQQSDVMAILKTQQIVIDDRDVVARIPGPHHEAMLPANDYVFVRPDPVETVRPSGVIIATHSLAGGNTRDMARRNWMLETWQGMRERWEVLQEPLDERVRQTLAWGKRLTHTDKVLMRQALDDGAVTDHTLNSCVPPLRVKRPNQGTIVALGPDVTPAQVQGAQPGDYCTWDEEFDGMDLYNGCESVLAIRVGFLAVTSEPLTEFQRWQEHLATNWGVPCPAR